MVRDHLDTQYNHVFQICHRCLLFLDNPVDQLILDTQLDLAILGNPWDHVGLLVHPYLLLDLYNLDIQWDPSDHIDQYNHEYHTAQ
jgi:hypothetical protein